VAECFVSRIRVCCFHHGLLSQVHLRWSSSPTTTRCKFSTSRSVVLLVRSCVLMVEHWLSCGCVICMFVNVRGIAAGSWMKLGWLLCSPCRFAQIYCVEARICWRRVWLAHGVNVEMPTLLVHSRWCNLVCGLC